MDCRHIGKWRLEIENAMICFINFLWKLLNWFSEGKYELHLSAPIKTLAAHQMIKHKKHWSCYLYQALSFTRLVDLSFELKKKTIFMKIYFSFEKMKTMVSLGKNEICFCCEKKWKICCRCTFVPHTCKCKMFTHVWLKHWIFIWFLTKRF